MPVLVRRSNPQLLDVLDEPARALLLRAAAVATRQGMGLWLVGGVLRDLLLGLPLERDIDLAVEGDAVALAYTLASELQGRVVATHIPFGTATVEVSGRSPAPEQEQAGAAGAHPASAQSPFWLDLAMTRVEHYAHPAALPEVRPAAISADLARRDFTINAIAMLLADGGAAPTLLDPFGGAEDLEVGVLRVLHDRSFDDDPTRILRGLRLAARLGLRPDPHTRELMEAALEAGRLEATSPDRVRAELCLALAEPDPSAVLRLADEWGVTPHIFLGLRWSQRIADCGLQIADCHRSNLQSAICNLQLIYAALLTYELGAEERAALAARYRLPGDAARVLRDLGDLQRRLASLEPEIRNSDLDRLLQPFDPVALVAAAAVEPAPARDLIRRYLAELRPLTTTLNGHDLRRLGVTPGPRLGQLLRELRAARLDGLVTTREEEEAWVRMRNREQRTENMG